MPRSRSVAASVVSESKSPGVSRANSVADSMVGSGAEMPDSRTPGEMRRVRSVTITVPSLDSGVFGHAAVRAATAAVPQNREETPEEEDHTKAKMSMQDKIFSLFEPTSEHASPAWRKASRVVVTLSMVITVLMAVLFTIGSMPTFYKQENTATRVMDTIETICVIFFTIELIARISAARPTFLFLLDFYNWTDVLSVLPYYIELILKMVGNGQNIDNLVVFRVLRVARMLRILRVTIYNRGLAVVLSAIAKSLVGLILLAIIMGSTALFFSAAMYFAEQSGARFDSASKSWIRSDGSISPYQSMLSACWWAVVTMGTVGYGDAVPITVPGRIVGGILVVFAAIAIAFPLLTINDEFQRAYNQGGNMELLRDRLRGLLSRTFITYEKMPTTLKEKIFSLFDPAAPHHSPAFSKASVIVSYFMFGVILLSCAVFVLQSLAATADNWMDTALFILDAICTAIFTLEFVVKLATCPDRKQFLKMPFTWVDILSFTPFYLENVILGPALRGTDIGLSGFGVMRTLRTVRVLRVFRISRYNFHVTVVICTLRASSDALLMILFLMGISMILFGSLVFYAEQGGADWDPGKKAWVRDGAPTAFQSIPMCFWYVIVTTTTVGYGDMVPYTTLGKLLGCCCCIVGVLSLTFPVAIIGRNYHEALIVYQQLKAERDERKANISFRVNRDATRELVSLYPHASPTEQITVEVLRPFELFGAIRKIFAPYPIPSSPTFMYYYSPLYLLETDPVDGRLKYTVETCRTQPRYLVRFNVLLNHPWVAEEVVKVLNNNGSPATTKRVACLPIAALAVAIEDLPASVRVTTGPPTSTVEVTLMASDSKTLDEVESLLQSTGFTVRATVAHATTPVRIAITNKAFRASLVNVALSSVHPGASTVHVHPGHLFSLCNALAECQSPPDAPFFDKAALRDAIYTHLAQMLPTSSTTDLGELPAMTYARDLLQPHHLTQLVNTVFQRSRPGMFRITPPSPTALRELRNLFGANPWSWLAGDLVATLEVPESEVLHLLRVDAGLCATLDDASEIKVEGCLVLAYQTAPYFEEGNFLVLNITIPSHIEELTLKMQSWAELGAADDDDDETN